MKTQQQIIRYLTHCRVSAADKDKIKDFCSPICPISTIQRLKKDPISTTTFEEFETWFNNGYGSGDYVKYGKTYGIIGDSVPGKTYLVAYLDFNGKLIVQEMQIMNPERLRRADGVGVMELNKQLFNVGLEYVAEESRFASICTPKNNLYYTLREKDGSGVNIGLYDKTQEDKYYFHAFLTHEGRLIKNHSVDVDYTPLKVASDKEIRVLHQALGKAGMQYSDMKKGMVDVDNTRKRKTKYWYLSDRWEMVMDIDNGEKRHKERYEAGNYFLDFTEGLMFMKEVRALRKGGLAPSS